MAAAGKLAILQAADGDVDRVGDRLDRDAAFRRRSLFAALLGQALSISIWIAGAVLICQGPGGVYWLVPGLLLTYLVALANAWVLTVEINR